MTDRELMQMALDALTVWELMQPQTTACAVRTPAIEALRARLSQPEPEELAQLEQAMIEAWKPIPQREWQGLTEMEKIEIQMLKWWDWEDTFDLDGYTRAIEAKLREKNT